MQASVQVTFRDMPVSDVIEEMCWKEAAKLERYFDKIVGCYVTVAESHRRHRQEILFEVQIVLSVSGHQLIVNREPAELHVDEGIEVAIREGFDYMRQQLQDHARKMRGQMKKHENGGEQHEVVERKIQPRP